MYVYLYIKRHIYYIMEKQQSRGHMYPQPWDTKPAKPSVRSTHCDRKPSRQAEPEANQTERRAASLTSQQLLHASVSIYVCVYIMHIYVCVQKRASSQRCRCHGRTVPENARRSMAVWMNGSRTHRYDSCRRKRRKRLTDDDASVAAVMCVHMRLMRGFKTQLTSQQGKYIRQSRSHVNERKPVIHNHAIVCMCAKA